MATPPSHPQADEPVVDSLEERLRWARRQGHPYYVWPDVRPKDWRKALVEIERVTRALLAGDGGRPTLAGGDDEASLAALDVAAFTSCMGPLLGWWVERGTLHASDRVRASLALHLEHGRRRELRMSGALREAVRALDAAGVRVTVLKGAHTWRISFPEPGLRPMSDLDLLVAPSDVSRAERVFQAAGYSLVPGSRLARPYRTNWRPPNAPANVRSFKVHVEDNPYTVDLHRSLDVPFFGVRTLRFDVPADTLVAAPWAGERATALAHPLLIAHLAAHTSRGLYNLTMIRLVELALLLRRDAGRSFTWDELSALLNRYRAERFGYPAFELVERLSPGAVDPAFRERLARAATPAQRRVIDRVTPATAQCQDGISLDERFMWAATPFEHVRRATRMLLPANMGWSLGRVGGVYVQRALRILRGRVAMRG